MNAITDCGSFIRRFASARCGGSRRSSLSVASSSLAESAVLWRFPHSGNPPSRRRPASARFRCGRRWCRHPHTFQAPGQPVPAVNRRSTILLTRTASLPKSGVSSCPRFVAVTGRPQKHQTQRASSAFAASSSSVDMATRCCQTAKSYSPTDQSRLRRGRQSTECKRKSGGNPSGKPPQDSRQEIRTSPVCTLCQ